MSERILIFAGENELLAKRLLTRLRDRDIGGVLRSAFIVEPEEAGRVIIMEDVPDFVARRIEDVFGCSICERRKVEPKREPKRLAEITAQFPEEHDPAPEMFKVHEELPVAKPRTRKRKG